jgi:hypothetical protein
MPEGDQDQRRVPMVIAAIPGGLDQLLDFRLGQVFASVGVEGTHLRRFVSVVIPNSRKRTSIPGFDFLHRLWVLHHSQLPDIL